jgi:hypothetical protein
MDTGLDSTRVKVRCERIARFSPYDKQMTDVSRPVLANRENKFGNALQAVEIISGNSDAMLTPAVEMAKLRAEDRGLQAVEPRAASLKFVIILGDAPVIGGHAHSFRQIFTTGNDCAGIAIGAEILAEIGAECPDIAYRAGPGGR